MTQNQKSAKTIVQFLLTRFIVLSAILILVFNMIVDQKSLYAFYLDYLRDDGEYLKRFKNEEVPFNRHQFEKKVIYYQTLIEYLPFKALAYSNLGFCYFHLEKYQEALDAYQKAIELDPKQYTFYYDFGVVVSRMKNYPLATAFFKQSIDKIPQMNAYYSYLEKTFQSVDALAFSKIFHDLTIQTQKDQELSFINLSLIYTGLKQYETAYRFALEGLKQQPQSSELHFYAGQATFMARKYQVAVNHFSQAIQLNPKSLKSYYYRGLCMRELKKTKGYQQDMQKVLILRKTQGEEAQEYSLDGASLHFYNDNWYFMTYGKKGGAEL